MVVGFRGYDFIVFVDRDFLKYWKWSYIWMRRYILGVFVGNNKYCFYKICIKFGILFYLDNGISSMK